MDKISLANSLISIIVPTYNREALLKETIQSLLDQTYRNIEILIIDDGSTDNTAQMVKGFTDPRISYLAIDHKGFPAPARNMGLKQAKGEYIAFVDSDDLWLPNKLEIQMDFFQLNPELNLIHTNAFVIPSMKSYLYLRKNVQLCFHKMAFDNWVMNSSVLFKKNIVSAIGLLDERPELKAIEDYDYWLRILDYKDNSILLIKDKLVKYRIHQTNLLMNEQNQVNVNIKQEVLEKIMVIFEKYQQKRASEMAQIIKERQIDAEMYRQKTLFYSNQLYLFAFLKIKYISLYQKLRSVGYKIIKKILS